MLVKEQRKHVQVSGEMEQHDFVIAASAQAFKILSSGLYSDKIRAIIRELSTNAWDSHVAAGTTDKPFIVNIPNDLDPNFWVRDFGTGLSDDDIKTIYRTYFQSNKNQSNEFTGCLGLGSKSPFAYTDQFTVTSFFNGEKSVYTAYINDKGTPSIAHRMTENTDEPNGLKVEIGVKKQDYYQFSSKTAEVLQWFPVHPTVQGISSLDYPKHNYCMEGEGYGVFQSKTYNQSAVIMGNVAYPLSVNDLNLNGHEYTLASWGLHLFVKIGEVEIAANREALGYTPKTVKVLRGKIKAILGDVKKAVEDKIANETDMWNARCILAELKTSSVLGEVSGIDSGTIDWNGHRLSCTINLDAFKSPNYAAPHVEMLNYEGASRRRRRRSSSGPTKALNKHNTTQFVAGHYPVFVNDLNRGGFAAAKRYLEENDEKQALMLSDVSLQWLARTGLNTHVIYTSSLPKPERAYTPREARRPREYSTLMKLRDYGTGDAASYWEQSEVDMKSETGVFVEFNWNKFRMIPNGSFEHPERLVPLVKNLAECGIDLTVYAVRPSDRKKIDKYEWEPFHDVAKAALERRVDRYQDEAQASMLWQDCECANQLNWFLQFEHHPRSFAGKLFAKLKKARDAAQKPGVTGFIESNKFFKVCKIEENKDTDSEWWNRLAEHYPLFHMIHSWNVNDVKQAEHLSHYIQSVDIAGLKQAKKRRGRKSEAA